MNLNIMELKSYEAVMFPTRAAWKGVFLHIVDLALLWLTREL